MVASPIEKMHGHSNVGGGQASRNSNQSGEVVVTKGGARRVSVFTPGGVKLRSFGEGQLMDPGGAVV